MTMPLRKAWNRVRNMVSFGSVNIVDDSGSVQMAQVQIGTLETRDNTPMVQHFGFSSNPPPGTKVVLAFVAGLKSNGAAIGSNSTAFRPRNMKSGESCLWDNLGRKVYLSADGIVIEANNSPVMVSNATTLTIIATEKVRMQTPRLEVTGDVIDNCDSQPETMAGQRAVYNPHTHPIPSGNTGPPNQAEP